MPEVNHNPQHRYDCDNCKFNWNCGLSCSCGLRGLPSAPESVKLARVKAFLDEGDRFIKTREDLERYIEGIWKES